MKRINYQSVIKRIKNIKTPKVNTPPIIILAEKLDDGSYQIAETFENYRRKDFIIENEEKFNKFIDSIESENCTIIIDDVLSCISKPMLDKVVLNCTNEELYKIINESEDQEKEIGQVITRNLKEITQLKGKIV